MDKYPEILLDADICIRFAKFKGDDYLIKLLEDICDLAYIHNYILKQELLTHRDQIDALINTRKVVEINPDLMLTGVSRRLYYANASLIYNKHTGENIDVEKVIMANGRKPHLGECVSAALAKVNGIPYFVTGDYGIYNINDVVNTEEISGQTLKIVHMDDIVKLFNDGKSEVFKRKVLKDIYTLDTGLKIKCKEEIQKEIKTKKDKFDMLWPND